MNYRLYRSECGRYLCLTRWSKERCAWQEAWSKDGKIHWTDGPKVHEWGARLFAHPFQVGGYSAEKAGQKKGSFTLTLLCCDARKIVEPWTGNTIVDGFDCVFRRKIPLQNYPAFIRSELAGGEA